jgi:CBS domain containing-hemolysin-like protein
MAVLISFAIIAILILINGLFVAAEFSIIGVRPTRVEQLAAGGNRAALWVQSVLGDRHKVDRYVATAQLGITLASLGLGMYAEPAIAHLIEPPLHDWFGLEGAIVHTISFIIALALITYLHVVVGEMVPKSLALHNAEGAVFALAAPMRLVGKLFSIPVTVLNHIGLWTLKLLRIPPPGENSRLYSIDELELLVEESYSQGLLDDQEQELVANIVDFAEDRVGQVMMPRPMMTAIPAGIEEEELLDLVATIPYTRLPVYRENIDDIIGFLHMKDLVRQQLSEAPFDLRALLRPVPFVPVNLPVQTLLAQFQRKSQQIAIVMDEYGGTLGLVTMEDLLEEVVGEVRDEFDVDEKEPFTFVEPGHLMARGAARLEDLEEYVSLGQQDVQTVGGLVWDLLGRRPVVGDQVTVGGVTLRVEAMDGLTTTRVSLLFSVPEASTPPPSGSAYSEDMD